MPANLYDYTVPALLRGLAVLRSYLDKMQAAVEAGRFTEKALLRARLAEDMLPLGRQFKIASDNARNGAARLAGQTAPTTADDEQTIGEHRQRIEDTIAFLRTLAPDAFEGSQARMIDQSYRRANAVMSGEDYLLSLLLPNFYFHVTVAHAILRHKGFPVGKSDYLGALPDRLSKPAPSPGAGSPIRFLTRAESIEWLAAHGLREAPASDRPGTSHFQFDLQPRPVRLSDFIGSLMDDLGDFDGGLLLLDDWIWDDEYETDPTAPYREARGETRALADVPGALLDASHRDDAVALLTLLVERAWTGQFHAASGTTSLRIEGGDRVHVHTVNPEAERLVRYRLVVSGSDVLPI